MLIVRYLGVVVAAAFAVASLTACGLTKSPADGLTFKAPDGWTATPGVMGRFQLWTSGGGDSAHVLMLLKLPADTKLNSSFSVNDFKDVDGPASLKDGRVLAQRTMTLCGSQRSMFVKMQGQTKNQKAEELVEAVLSKAADGTYMAMYMHPIAVAPNPAAEAAIYELCPGA
jgi:hypothetical protein